MAIAFVKATKIETTSGTSANGTVANTAGNAWITAASCGSATATVTMSDSATGTWTQDVKGPQSGGVGLSINSRPNLPGGNTTVTISKSGAAAKLVALVSEFSGLPTSSMLDSTPPAAATGSSTSATTPSETNTNANAVFFACVGDNNSSATSTLTGNTAGWNYNPSSTDETNGSSFIVTGSAYRIVNATGTQSANWTVTSSSWVALIACYKAVATARPMWLAQKTRGVILGTGIY